MDNRQRRQEAMKKLHNSLAARERKGKFQPFAVAAAALAIIVVVAGGIWWAATRTPHDEPTTITADGKRATELPETVTCEYTKTGEAARQVPLPGTTNISARGTVTVTLKTQQGPIDMKLDRAASPCTVNAITHLAKEGFYNDTVCHRLTTDGIFVLQCGDPTGKGTGGPGFQFKNEYPTDQPDLAQQQTITYPRGSIAMANSRPDTNGSQFFLNYKDSPLQPNYTYFGQLGSEGLKTLDKIAAKGTKGGVPDGQPADEVRISTATVS